VKNFFKFFLGAFGPSPFAINQFEYSENQKITYDQLFALWQTIAPLRSINLGTQKNKKK
jgi:hypothetical protein